MKKYLGLFLVAGLGGLVALGLNRLFVKQDSSMFQEQRLARFAALTDLGARTDFVEVAELVTPTVVFIKTTIEPQQNQQNEQEQKQMNPFDFFNGPGFNFPGVPQGPQSAQGSGVIISQDGYIVTNNHVVEGATKVKVVLNDKREYDAEILGKDKNTDLALLRIDEKNLPFAIIGNSDEVKVGQWALAVGNPFGLTSTVTAGIISAKGRNINIVGERDRNGAPTSYPIESFIQTDAAVNPGNSGGALISSEGKLIGINTAIASQTGQYAGYSFAIPVNLMKKVIDDLTKYGIVQRGVLGVQIQDVTSELADKEGLKDIKGVFVQKVKQGSAAEDAGIKDKDVILSIDGTKVNSSPELQELIGKKNPGDKVKILVARDGKERTIEVTLKSLEGKTEMVKGEKLEINKVLDCEFESISREERLKMHIPNGVRVKKVGEKSVLKRVGVPEGFIITAIEHKMVNTPADVKTMLENKKGGTLMEGIRSDGAKGLFAFDPSAKN